MLDFSQSLPGQIFINKPESIFLYDYDEILFGNFFSTLWLAGEQAVYLTSREMILSNIDPVSVKLSQNFTLSEELDRVGLLDATYNCRDFFLWNVAATWHYVHPET